MATVDGPMVISAATSVALRPLRSPKCPNKAAPNGRAKKANAKVARDSSVAKAGSLPGKNNFGKTNTAAVAYSTTYGQYPANLSSLTTNGTASSTAADLIDTVLGTGTKSGYSFTYTVGAGNAAFTVTASPVLLNVTGQRYFFTYQTFVIRANTSGAATSGSAPIS